MGGQSRAQHVSDGVYRSAAATISLLSGKWTSGVVLSLADGRQRFTALQRLLPGISHYILTKELKKLQLHGVISRTVYPTTPPAVEYELSDSGFALCEVLRSASEWAAHYSRKESSQDQDIEITK